MIPLALHLKLASGKSGDGSLVISLEIHMYN